MPENSRGLIRSMAVIASSQAVNILISIVRMKVLATLLGPTGVGMVSIYSNLQGVVTTAAGLGIGSSGIREIACVKGEEQTLSRVKRVLLVAHLIQGLLAMGLVWLLRAQISEWLFGNLSYATEVGLIGLAVFLTLVGTAHTALLQGMRRVADFARVTVLSTLLGTIVGVAAVWFYGEPGLIWFVVAQPLAMMVTAMRYTRRLPLHKSVCSSSAEVWNVWKQMAKLGVAFMLGGLATMATLLLVRGTITQELGLEAAGQFAAAWGISTTYVGFLLAAMAADYYPRLTEVVNDRAAATRLVNDQAQIALAIGGPVLLSLIGLAPWAVTLLYSTEFLPAVELLQWQTVGNVFKLTSWAMVFFVAAAARSKTYVLLELSFNTVFLALIWCLSPVYGLKVTGIAFFVGYVAYFLAAYMVTRTFLGFHWQKLSLSLLTLHATLALGLLAVAQIAPHLAAIASIMLAMLTGIYGMRVVLSKMSMQGNLSRQLYRIFARFGWPVQKEKEY